MSHQAAFTLGGLKHSLRVRLELAPRIEDALGLGLIVIARRLAGQELTTTQVAEIIRVAFEADGKVYDTEQVAAMMTGHEGYLAGFGAALQIVNQLFKKPEKTGQKKDQPGNGQTAAATASH